MVIKYFFGNKDSFAVEFAVQRERYSRHLMGNLRLWLGGNYIGAYEDINILSTTLHDLHVLTTKNICSDSFDGINEEQVYQFIKSDDNLEGGRYFFHPGEAFDDFSAVVYRHNGMFKFIWKLEEKPFFEYENYPKGFQWAEVPEDEFRDVVVDFSKQLEELAKVIPIIESQHLIDNP